MLLAAPKRTLFTTGVLHSGPMLSLSTLECQRASTLENFYEYLVRE